MSIKQKVLDTLEQNKGTSISGEALANMLSVSRSAVWKAVNSLKKEGYKIDAVNNKGYTLSQETDVISASGVKKHLKQDYSGMEIFCLKTIDSTNKYAKQLVIDGKKELSLVISEEQTDGKGRHGRSFFSPSNKGIYMSLIIPCADKPNIAMVTTAAAVAVCKALRELTSQDCQIKWVNDVFIGNRKICGILSEAISNIEIRQIETVIVGIGINVSTDNQSFPEELREIAGSLGDENPISTTRNEIIAGIINNLIELSSDLDNTDYLEYYKEHSMIIGSEIEYSYNGEWKNAYAVDINDRGELIVEADGKNLTLSSGEIRVRRK